MINKLPVIIGILFIIFVRSAYPYEDRIVAIVNDDIITLADLQNYRKEREVNISDIIEKRLIYEEAKRLGMDVNQPEEVIAGKVIRREISPKIVISDKDIENYYNIHRESFKEPDKVRIGYVLLTEENIPLIKEIIKDLRQGSSLEELASLYSYETTLKIVSDLGFVQKGHLMPELDKEVFKLKKGDISPPIKTSRGIYIIKVLDVKKNNYIPLQQIKDRVRNLVFQEKIEEAYVKWMYEIKKTSFIKINYP